MTDDRVQKVAALVLRGPPANSELLVFDHSLEGGGTMTQVPAGTIEPAEPPELAASRELLEETGIEAKLVGLAGVRDEEFEGERRRRWVYLFESSTEDRDSWPYKCDCGMPIRIYWVPFGDANIAGNQQPWLDMARERLSKGRPEAAS